MTTVYPDQRVIRTRLKLKRSLLETISDHSIKELTVASLCKQARINRTTFYHHFDSIDDLINQLLNELIDEIITAYRKPYTQLTSFHLRDLHFSEITLFHSIIEKRDVFTQIVYSAFLPLFQQKLNQAIKKIMLSDLSPSGGVDHELFATYHSVAISGLIIYWIQTGFSRSPDEMADQLLWIVRQHPDQRFKVKTILSPLLIEMNRQSSCGSNDTVNN